MRRCRRCRCGRAASSVSIGRSPVMLDDLVAAGEACSELACFQAGDVVRLGQGGEHLVLDGRVLAIPPSIWSMKTCRAGSMPVAEYAAVVSAKSWRRSVRPSELLRGLLRGLGDECCAKRPASPGADRPGGRLDGAEKVAECSRAESSAAWLMPRPAQRDRAARPPRPGDVRKDLGLDREVAPPRLDVDGTTSLGRTGGRGVGHDGAPRFVPRRATGNGCSCPDSMTGGASGMRLDGSRGTAGHAED